MMQAAIIWIGLLLPAPTAPAGAQTGKAKIFVVSSYHREYLWSQDTQRGRGAGLLEVGFLEHASRPTNSHARTASKAPPAWWRKCGWIPNARAARMRWRWRPSVMAALSRFAPDLVLLGDDNAANYIGNQLVDTEVPAVFWGVNGLPLKYGLLDSLDRPGHNVTGVYQPGYPKECLEFLQRLAPRVRTFAILSDDSETGRSKAKGLESLADAGGLPLELVGSVVTNSLEQWQA